MIRLPFEFMGKSLTEAYILSLSKKGETAEIKGLLKDGIKVNGKLRLNGNFELELLSES
jgi:hypothetical protein